MCGIVGFISPQRTDAIVEKMLNIQAYRGPDDRGVFVEKVLEQFIHLGHNRLAIQDLSYHGHQPFVSDCGNYVIVYNGEVYNFKSIKIELEKLGYRFVSQSDTEVILYAYKEWGMDSLKKFIGMFAFSILDKLKEKLTLVRDRAGVKPLYYYDNGNEFIFASELKSFHEHPSFKKELQKEVLPYYFQFGYIPAPYSIFKHAYKLEPGHYLEYDLKNDTYANVKYWDVDECYNKEKFEAGEKEILDELELLLSDASNLRMISDVPVGVFLSGGYDSSLLTALLSKDSQRKLQTFTIGFDDKKYNEAEHAKHVAKYFGTEHTEYYVSNNDMLRHVENLPFYHDEPFGANSAIATMVVSEVAKKDVTVALSADGGDEAFCGYSKYFYLQKFSNIFTGKFKKIMLQTALDIFDENMVESVNSILPQGIRQTNIKEKYNKFKRAVGSDSLEEMFVNASSLVAKSEVKALLKNEIDSDFYAKFTMNKGKDLIDEMMRIDYKTFMVDEVLTKVDRATMSVSLEGREPFLDHRIIEFMARVPVSLKYKNNQGKYLAREILYKYIPKEIIDKPKAGFQMPLHAWLKNDLRHLVEKYLNSRRIDDEIFNVEEVEKIKRELFLENYTNVNKVWFIVMYEMWREKWF